MVRAPSPMARSHSSISTYSIWYGVQASIGGSCVLVMLRAMWPSVNNIREQTVTVYNRL